MTLCEEQTGGKILCIRLSGLGDIVHALNALSLLRTCRPNASITWVVEDRFRELVSGHPQIDEVISIPRSSWGRLLSHPLQWPQLGEEVVSVVGRLRRRHFDVSLDFQSSAKSAWLVAAAGADLRIGFSRRVARELSHLAQNRRVDVDPESCHRVERNLALLAPLGIPTRYADPVLVCSKRNEESVNRFFQGASWARPLVIIHPGTSEFARFKRWQPGRFAAVADRLIATVKATVLITWGPGEGELARSVLDSMDHEALLGPRAHNLQQLIHLLGYGDLFIGCDTGPLHLASALGVPVVALFGPKDPVQTGPYCSRAAVVSGTAFCRPCSRRICERVLCMESITVEDVFKAARSVLGGGGEKRARQGRLKALASMRFNLGKWHGRCLTWCAHPHFFRWLCDPMAAMAKGIVEGSGGGGASAAVDLELEDEELPVAVVEEARGGVCARLLRSRFGTMPGRRWRGALALARNGIPVRQHLCFLQRTGPCAEEAFLVCERVEGTVTVKEWLAARGLSCWQELPAGRKAAFTDAVARLWRVLHGRGFYHGPADGADILILWPGGRPGPELSFSGLGSLLRIGWLPVGIQDLLKGVDLGGLLRWLRVSARSECAERFFRSYFGRFTGGLHRRRLITWIAGRWAGRGGGTSRCGGGSDSLGKDECND